MPYDAFPTSPKPERGQQVDVAHRHLSSEYGDGYELAEPAGINTKMRDLSARFVALKEAEKNTIESFLDSQGGHKPFRWTLEGGTEILVLCRGFSFSSGDGDLFELNLRLKQTYRADV